MSDSIYCYEGTKVLINKLDIHDDDKLKEIESEIAATKLAQLNLVPDYVKRTWDFNHYINIHKFLFEEIYDFAGKIRKENISKSNEPYRHDKKYFCPVSTRFIANNIEYWLEDNILKMNNEYKKIKTKEDLVKFICKYYLEFNAIHPFREGNGRTQREFISEYIERINEENDLNYEIDYKMDENLREKFYKASVLEDEVLMYDVFDTIIVEKELKHEKGFSR